MQQEINLYASLPQPSKTISLKQMTIIYAIFMLLLFTIYGYQYYRSASVINELQKFNQLRANAVEQLISLTPQITPLTSSSMVDMQHELATRGLLLRALSSGKRWVDYFTALSQTIPNGVWLTAIDVRDMSEEIILQGKANNRILIQHFLSNLNHHPIFKGQTLSLVNISQESVKSNAMSQQPLVFSIQLKIAEQSYD